MKFRIPNPKLEDELAVEHLKRMKEDGVMDFWPTLLYDEPDNKVPEEPDKNNLTLRK
jgi:hypothetical protein